MKILLAYILIALLASPAIAQSADLIQTGNIVGGAIQASGNFKRICRCVCFDSSHMVFFDDDCLDPYFDDPTISDPLQCQRLDGIGSRGRSYLRKPDDGGLGLCDSKSVLPCSLTQCSIVAVPIQP